ncbi:MAG: bifunctional UDP-N-acetylglucosamine diphosphorylase/glucosamine-1-phosphate N-acetyltransferase GlmU, partial [Hyphomicrobiaceae bacterium]|nr:bifunctional UDP-N-acetylglucosamine diphosphorylase/glucosamine-1-phosphate N-acetyltransferase GlmU [Hyphomicrobiaceae bacterium]
MTERSCLMIVLAAGEGTRMRSALPKVLHQVGGLPMVGHVVRTARAAGASRLAAVVGPNADAVAATVTRFAPDASVFEQRDRLGTAHAVLQARAALAEPADDVLVLFSDTPLVRPETLARVRARLADGADIVVLGFEAENPHGYGRLLERDGRLVAIREEKDASDEERKVRFSNSGIMAFRGAHALSIIESIGNANAKGEYYLTDAIEIAHARGLVAVAERGEEREFLGVNDRSQLAICEAVFQDRMRAAAMAAGVTLMSPSTVFFSYDTELGRDVVVEPNVVFAPGVKVEANVQIRAFCHLEGALVRSGATVGPYARLRPKADIGEGAHIGNFVEIKAARIETGAKVNHLTYIGDARVGAKANIGAGTITCNYDGFGKYHTDIGAGAFIGSNSSLVAPVSIGDGAIVGAGSVVTTDVEA